MLKGLGDRGGEARKIQAKGVVPGVRSQGRLCRGGETVSEEVPGCRVPSQQDSALTVRVTDSSEPGGKQLQ